jgi:hypothetical protein
MAKMRCPSLTKHLIKTCTVQFSTGLGILRTLQDGVLIQNMFAQRYNNTWIVMPYNASIVGQWLMWKGLQRSRALGGHPPSHFLTIFPQVVGVICQVLF